MMYQNSFQNWIFDLDNTLYSATTNVFEKIDKKMCDFIMENLNVSKNEALKIHQKSMKPRKENNKNIIEKI